ncbi:alpha-ketoacid dehydrogenase subunit beta [Rothia aerolata]|uniref:2-oxoisovalerate dehydrogenase subunit beta n=1 Tax=Rothia aerolata TaxID=1812262 RepID=A0A917ISV5_9MICC|nr:alpha-ketoacid dehydrogenase subunit beta [Rothia aerolata]GGH61737.1 2-oxoisovalerate dehydrogenase subunit beta [Rothia aerolata]
MTVEKLPLSKAITRALRYEMVSNPKVVVLGEDVGKLGGVFRVTDGLQAEFGPKRVMDSPLGEAGIIGTSIGMAMRGYRPVPEIQFDGFVFPSFNQITSQLSKIYSRTAGQYQVPVTIRLPYGGAVGSPEHHSDSPEAYFAHTPGLRVLTPSSAHDAYWMLRKSIEHPDPVIFLEPKRRYWAKGDVDFSDESYDPFKAAVLREGSDLTLVTYGPLVPVALAAAEAAVEDGHDLEVIDLRSISPMDTETVAASVEKTGRLVIAQEAPSFVSVGSELAAAIAERCFFSLEAPVLRVGGFHMPYPVPRAEKEYVPGIDRILEAVDRSFTY